MTICPSTRVRPAENVLVREVDGESVFLDLASESYFGLADVGTRMWQVVTTNDSVAAACAVLCEEYEVEPARLREDLDALIEELRAHGLVDLDPQ